MCVADKQLLEVTSQQLEALFRYSVTGDSAYLLAPQRPLMDAQDEDGDRSVNIFTECHLQKYLNKCFTIKWK